MRTRKRYSRLDISRRQGIQRDAFVLRMGVRKLEASAANDRLRDTGPKRHYDFHSSN